MPLRAWTEIFVMHAELQDVLFKDVLIAHNLCAIVLTLTPCNSLFLLLAEMSVNLLLGLKLWMEVPTACNNSNNSKTHLTQQDGSIFAQHNRAASDFHQTMRWRSSTYADVEPWLLQLHVHC
jgi:hypothetical protein